MFAPGDFICCRLHVCHTPALSVMIHYPTSLQSDDFLKVVWNPQDPLHLTFEKKVNGDWIILSRHRLNPMPQGMKELLQVMDDYYYHGMVTIAENALSKAN